MTKLAYLECPTGLAGDMCLGALIHAGVPLDYLIEKLSLLKIADEYQLRAELVHRNGQQSTKVHVELATTHSQSDRSQLDRSDHSGHSEAEPQSEHESLTFADRHSDPSKLRSTYSQSDHSAPGGHADPHSHAGHEHEHQHSNRHLPEITTLIAAAGLPARVEAWSLAIFRQLAEAEGAVHGISPDQVHFHEVGATDAIVDIVGTCLGLDWLGIDELYCSAIPVGGGTVRAAHGLLPVPAPAVLKLLEMRQVPIYSNGINRELVTPTGAAIVTTLARQFGPPPPMTLQRVGLGAGSRNLIMPNILRLWVGNSQADAMPSLTSNLPIRTHSQNLAEFSGLQPSVAQPSVSQPSAHQSVIEPASIVETIVVLETQIDDLNPQAIGYLFEVLFAAGALDVFTQAIGMKKSRPGVLLTVICHPDHANACEAVIFQETTTLGIRRSQQQRSILEREIQTVETIYGTVRVKVARRTSIGTISNAQPEYEDCATLARQAQVPWHEVHRLALWEWHNEPR